MVDYVNKSVRTVVDYEKTDSTASVGRVEAN